jgi:hypothetical protein
LTNTTAPARAATSRQASRALAEPASTGLGPRETSGLWADLGIGLLEAG